MKGNQILGPPLLDSHEGKDNRTLLVEMLQQQSLMDYRLSVADEQRKLLIEDIRKIDERTRDAVSLSRDVEILQNKVKVLDDLRLMGLGGAYMAKFFWAIGGGVLVALVTYFLKGGK